mmetsp:Transcript_45785/g.127077  ORF Transcript_45785/g.127077 Transcript_45785/m.127077 type:complete len:225 (-) Transcript_45785:192-866(-)
MRPRRWQRRRRQLMRRPGRVAGERRAAAAAAVVVVVVRMATPKAAAAMVAAVAVARGARRPRPRGRGLNFRHNGSMWSTSRSAAVPSATTAACRTSVSQPPCGPTWTSWGKLRKTKSSLRSSRETSPTRPCCRRRSKRSSVRWVVAARAATKAEAVEVGTWTLGNSSRTTALSTSSRTEWAAAPRKACATHGVAHRYGRAPSCRRLRGGHRRARAARRGSLSCS